MNDVHSLGNLGLLARCFLETKIYDIELWSEFVKLQKFVLLKTPETEWDEKWLRELQLFNVVVRDASHCAIHTTKVADRSNLDDFLRSIVGKQRDSLAKVLLACAEQDAAAALRLAEAGKLSLVEDFPQIVVEHCDQAPFLALVLEKVSHETEHIEVLAGLLVEAAFRSTVVASALFEKEPSALLRNRLLGVPPERMWFKKRILPERLFTQLLSIALWEPSVRAGSDALGALSSVPAPGERWACSKGASIGVGLGLVTCGVLLITLVVASLFLASSRAPHTNFGTTFKALVTILGAGSCFWMMWQWRKVSYYFGASLGDSYRGTLLGGRAGGPYAVGGGPLQFSRRFR